MTIMFYSIAYAAPSPGSVETAAFVAKFNDAILFPVISLLFGLALLYFMYGCFIFIANADNSSARETGRSHIIYSVIGMLVMLLAYTVLSIAANTFGLKPQLDCSKNPSGAGCGTLMVPNP